mgnify:FL=1
MTTIAMNTTAGSTDKLLWLTGTSVLRDVTLDGRRTERGWPGGYSWEQSCLARMIDGTLDVDRVTLTNSPGDGITILCNVTATLDDVTASNCFRSAVTITGGNTSVTINRLTGSWLQIEYDTPGTGGSNVIALTMNDSSLPEGVELEAWGAVTITNTDLGRRFWIEGRGGAPVRITDCTIGLSKSEADFGGAFTDPDQLTAFGCSIYYPRDIVFTRCTFTGRPGVGLELRPFALPVFSATGQSVIFDACRFVGTGGTAVYNYGDTIGAGRTNTVEFRNGCTFTGYDTGYELRPGCSGTLVGSLVAG